MQWKLRKVVKQRVACCSCQELLRRFVRKEVGIREVLVVRQEVVVRKKTVVWEKEIARQRLVVRKVILRPEVLVRELRFRPEVVVPEMSFRQEVVVGEVIPERRVVARELFLAHEVVVEDGVRQVARVKLGATSNVSGVTEELLGHAAQGRHTSLDESRDLLRLVPIPSVTVIAKTGV